MKPQKAKYEENAFLSRGGGRDNPGHTTPGHPGTRSRGPPRDTPGHAPGTPRDTVTGRAPGHPGTRTRDAPGQLVFMKAGGPGTRSGTQALKREQKYKTYRYIVLCWGEEEEAPQEDEGYPPKWGGRPARRQGYPSSGPKRAK